MIPPPPGIIHADDIRNPFLESLRIIFLITSRILALFPGAGHLEWAEVPKLDDLKVEVDDIETGRMRRSSAHARFCRDVFVDQIDKKPAFDEQENTRVARIDK